jgi:hypothetical protein
MAGPHPSYATLAAGAPPNEDRRLPPPWRDAISTALLAVVPGTGTVWFTQHHALLAPSFEDRYSDDYGRGALHLLQPAFSKVELVRRDAPGGHVRVGDRT